MAGTRLQGLVKVPFHPSGTGRAVQLQRQLLVRSQDDAEIEKQASESHLHSGFRPGDATQVDSGKGPTITDVFTGEVTRTWIFAMTLCFSRHMYAEMVADQKVGNWLASYRRAFEFFGGVPARIIIDYVPRNIIDDVGDMI
jgi:transposase